jgi:hypothetical protein
VEKKFYSRLMKHEFKIILMVGQQECVGLIREITRKIENVRKFKNNIWKINFSQMSQTSKNQPKTQKEKEENNNNRLAHKLK